MVNLKEILDLISGGTTKKEQELIEKAYKFGGMAHLGQKRMSGEPYFNHVFETAKILANLGMDAQTIAVGRDNHVLSCFEIRDHMRIKIRQCAGRSIFQAFTARRCDIVRHAPDLDLLVSKPFGGLRLVHAL